MQKIKPSFSGIVLNTSIVIFILISLAGLVFYTTIDYTFFLKYSPDKQLKESTIRSIDILSFCFFMVFVIFAFFAIFFFIFKGKIRVFIAFHKEIIKNLFVMCCAIIILLLLMEGILCIYLRHETFDAGIGPGAARFNKEFIKINLDGMRDREFDISKLIGTTRIAGIGDSFTYGYGIKNINDTYLKILEREINSAQKNSSYEILNFAIPGYDTPEHLSTIKNKALKYKPDIMIIGSVLNDFPTIDPATQGQTTTISIPFLGFWLREISYTYYFIETRINRALENINLKTKFQDVLMQRYYSKMNQEENDRMYDEIKSIAQQNNITVVMVIFPLFEQLDNYQFIEAHKIIRRAGEKRGFYVLDLYEAVYNGMDASKLINNAQDHHPNEAAHNLAAEEILKFLTEKKIITQERI